ncbi:hypothetical protein MPDQ_007607 [Monascus purpureus]|uniref:Alcohol dehydrogenase-like N-terminal domain-containing protein n=1 Tax=Monascus purpureus TaxID=5098 RepID=A0A507QRS0_MONPU|nr:hypothetical protein MPDQ_007607 [Monascus purpureus]
MALLAPEIMSTTSTCLQLDELNERSLQNHIPNRREVPRHIYLQSGTLEAATLQEIPSPSSELESQSQYQLESQRPGFTPIGEQCQRQELKQRALLLKAAREQYTLVTDHDIPSISQKGEILIKVAAIGLNPIDWKAPAFNFGIPSLPWVNGRDLAGTIVQVADEFESELQAEGKTTRRLRVGDTVLVPSTDYRDIRKAAFQEYAIATHFNAARIPSGVPVHVSASLGVAFVASVLALGVSFGLDLSSAERVPGPDFVRILRDIGENSGRIPDDIREECFSGKEEAERIKRGDWLAIWGASTTTGYLTIQLAKLAGLNVICVADVARHGKKLYHAGADLLVDRHNPERAIEIIRGVTEGKLRYALDIVGRETATLLQGALHDPTSSSTGDNEASANQTGKSHLLGLTGIPKEQDRNPAFAYHTVPIKLFHSSPAVGEGLVTWLEELLSAGALTLPETVHAEGGLGGINAALESLRDGTVSGKRIVVSI